MRRWGRGVQGAEWIMQVVDEVASNACRAWLEIWPGSQSVSVRKGAVVLQKQATQKLRG